MPKLDNSRPLTNRYVTALMNEAGDHGDIVTHHACAVWLGQGSPVTEASMEEAFGGGGLDRFEKAEILAITDVEKAENVIELAMVAA